MKKILITGSGGFIGRNLVENLKEEYQIVAPKRQELDLADTEETERYLRKQSVDAVIHCANTNNTRFGVGIISDYNLLYANLRMYWNLARCADLYGKMYYFGSGAEFDVKHYILSMPEDYFGVYIPQDPYGFSKYIMNQNTRKSKNIYNLRLFGVYGKYEEWNRRFISNNICRILRGLDISINQDMQFDYLYINDLCSIVSWFIEHTPKYHDYNICTGKSVRLSELANLLQSKCQCTQPIRIKQDGEKLPYTGDNKRLLNEFKKLEFTNVSIAMDELIEFYKRRYVTDTMFQNQLNEFVFS